MHPSDNMCPECGDGNFDGYCWDCGYDNELGPNLIDQLDSELECQKIDMGVYDEDVEDEHAGRDGRYDGWKG